MTILSAFDIGLVVLILAVGAATIAKRDAFAAVIGYVVYGREIDYPPGHVNHLMRKDL